MTVSICYLSKKTPCFFESETRLLVIFLRYFSPSLVVPHLVASCSLIFCPRLLILRSYFPLDPPNSICVFLCVRKHRNDQTFFTISLSHISLRSVLRYNGSLLDRSGNVACKCQGAAQNAQCLADHMASAGSDRHCELTTCRFPHSFPAKIKGFWANNLDFFLHPLAFTRVE